MKKFSLTSWILLSLCAGLVFGLAAHSAFSAEFNEGIVKWVFQPIGSIFLRAITMLVVPIVLVSLIYGAASVGDPKKLGRVGLKVVVLYLGTTAIAVTIALVLAAGIVRPGEAITIPTDTVYQPKEAPFVMDVFVNMIPKNPFQSMVEGSMLQIILFALLIGIALAQLGRRNEPIMNILKLTNDMLMRVVEIVLWLAVPGVFALISKVFIEQGLDVLMPLIGYVLTLVAALALQVIVVYPLVLSVLGRVSPLQFYKNTIPALTVAFSTSSSNATLPVTMEVNETRNGVSSGIASFALPLGATINMDGTAIMQGVATAFIAQVYSVHLGMTDMLTVVLTASLASIGAAGVPSVGLITLTMVLTSVNLPVEGIALIIGVDRLLDMMRTAVNVTGDSAAAVVIAKSEGELNLEIFNQDNPDFNIK